MDELLGRVLGHYELVAKLGTGGMGAVYRGVHQTLQQPRAIKILKPDLADEPDVVARFRREATIAAGLRHPHIVLIYDVSEDNATHYIVMDLLAGGSLRDVIRRSGPLPADRAVALLSQLASALDYAHGQGVIHRDIKPANVMVGLDDHVTLVDFGIARAADEARLTRSGSVVGTAEYMAPESFTNMGSERSSDLYALGIIAYELLTGNVPFRGDPTRVSYAQVNNAPPPPRLQMPSLPVAVEAVLLRQLSKQSSLRYPDASSFVAALAEAGAPARGEDAPTSAFTQAEISPRPGWSPRPPEAQPSQPSPATPFPQPRPTPPPPLGPSAAGPGTVYQALPPAHSSTKRLAIFVLVVLALILVGSVAIWQTSSGGTTVAVATSAPYAQPTPTVALAAATAVPKPAPATAVQSAPQPTAVAAPAPAAAAQSPAAQSPAAQSPAAQSPAAQSPVAAARATDPPSSAPAVPATSPAVAAATPSANGPPSPVALRTVLEERFTDNQRGWPNNPEGTASLIQGVYRLFAREPNRFVAVGAPGLGAFADVEVTGRFRKVGGPPGGGFGIIVRDQGPDARDGVSQGGRYYVLEIGEGTQWGAWRRDTDRWIDLVVWTDLSAVRLPPETNELTVRAAGPRMTFIVNGVQVATVSDPTLDRGQVGIYVAGDGNIVEVEQFTVRAPQ